MEDKILSETDKEEKTQILKNAIKSYPNFPKPGVVFRDIFSIFLDVKASKVMKDLIMDHIRPFEIDVVVGLDSRGFLLGPLISMEIDKPFLPIRKKGKLPGKVLQESFSLEYGEATFEIQTDQIPKDTRVLVVDDLLATGGSMGAAVELLKLTNADVVECLVIMELPKLKGREKINAPVYSFIQFD